jgi:hypothetical protein
MFSSPVKLFSSEGMNPDIMLLAKFKSVSSFISPTRLGMPPVKKFDERSRTRRLTRDPKASGKEPPKLEFFKDKIERKGVWWVRSVHWIWTPGMEQVLIMRAWRLGRPASEGQVEAWQAAS